MNRPPSSAFAFLRSAFVVLLVTLGPLPGCSSSPPDVIIVLIDTLRYDRLGVYGNERGLTPFLDSFAEQAYVFERAYAQSSWTNPSVASLFTSRYQSQHQLTEFGSVLEPEEITLAEVLGNRGYATAGFCANILVSHRSGFDQGFDLFRTIAERNFAKGRAAHVNHEALAWLDEHTAGEGSRAPVFLYLHYMEPHNPYDPPEPLLERVLNGRPRPNLEDVNGDMAIANLVDFTDETVQAVRDAYDAEVMSLDAALRELFEALAVRGVLDRAVIVVTADHGEEFMEHGHMGHQRTLYEEVIRIPLLVRLPGQSRRIDVGRVAMLTDVAPSVLALARIDPAPSFSGQVLAPLTRGTGLWGRITSLWTRDEPPRPAFSELIRRHVGQPPHEHTVILDRRKLIADVGGGRELYDLRDDPGEKNPNGLVDPQRALLSATLSTFLKDRVSAAPGAVRTIDPETREHMRALGYDDQ